ncbi:MAG: methyltransferase family protein [Chloroflexaceae bacterium]
MVISILLIGGYALVYALIHSWTASQSFKNWVRRRAGPAGDRWYRLAYNLVSGILLLPFLPLLLWLPDQVLYTVGPPWRRLLLLGQAAALAGIAYGIWLTDPWHFLGLRQLNPADSSNDPVRATEQPHLVVAGPYRWVRHPLYFFGLPAIWLIPQMTVNRLVLALVFSLYLYVGTFFEERRLLREFGAEYRAYQRRVPRLLPRVRRGAGRE